MPTILDNRSKIKKLDSQNMLGSLELLGEQVKQMCKQKVTLPASYRKVKNVVVLGMGGSTLGSHVIKALYANTLTVPVDIINGYHVPASVSEHTLVIVSSYSGTTEEPVAAGKEALAKKAKVLTISSGGTLKTWALKNKLPAILFTTENNPCGSPRMGLGYSIVGQLLIFAAAGLISLSEKESKIILTTIAKYQALFGVDVPSRYNFAKGLALASVGKTVQNYSNLLKDLTKKSDFTIATFGIGADGHTAGILPGSAAVDAQQPVYGYVWQDYVRMTITPNWLVGVDKAFVVARGQAKLDALSRLKAAASSTAELPSMLLNKIKDVVVYTDIKELL
jgi:hypothetical protein